MDAKPHVKIAFRPTTQPDTVPDPSQGINDPGTSWLYLDFRGSRVATVYQLSEDAGGGWGADMAAHPYLGKGAFSLIVGAGLPRLPKTRDRHAIDDDGRLKLGVRIPAGPLTREEVTAEVEALLLEDGWTVRDRPLGMGRQ